jgi:hypothetical protein
MIHDMRHCCASWLMMNGADLNDDVWQILGHKSIAMTLRMLPFAAITLPNSCQMQDATRSNSVEVSANRNKSYVGSFPARKHKEAT